MWYINSKLEYIKSALVSCTLERHLALQSIGITNTEVTYQLKIWKNMEVEAAKEVDIISNSNTKTKDQTPESLNS